MLSENRILWKTFLTRTCAPHFTFTYTLSSYQVYWECITLALTLSCRTGHVLGTAAAPLASATATSAGPGRPVARGTTECSAASPTAPTTAPTTSPPDTAPATRPGPDNTATSVSISHDDEIVHTRRCPATLVHTLHWNPRLFL